jgi:hypothetical protein
MGEGREECVCVCVCERERERERERTGERGEGRGERGERRERGQRMGARLHLVVLHVFPVHRVEQHLSCRDRLEQLLGQHLVDVVLTEVNSRYHDATCSAAPTSTVTMPTTTQR